MIAFLHWLRATLLGMLSGLARFVLMLVLLLVLLLAVVLVIELARGDGLPHTILLTLDLRAPIADSSDRPSLGIVPQPVTVMDLLFALRDAAKDNRVKGVLMRIGGGGLSVAEAEEIGAALAQFRKSGKFVIAQATDFSGIGLGDYLTAAAADQIWAQPGATFGVSGPGGAEIFLRGLFDKAQAQPQIVKRAEYKSAADMYMEKNMTDADRLQLTEVMQSWYGAAVGAVAADRKLAPEAVHAAFEASPQLSEDARKEGLIDKTGYDDDARAAAIARAGSGAEAVTMSDYIAAHAAASGLSGHAPIAVIAASGEIVDGSAGNSLFGTGGGIASDDLSDAIRRATRDKSVKAIVLRVDSPGGSVSASDQILDAVKKAEASGKKVVVSMGSVAASGGYYISASADRIVAEPGTLTGSIGVLTGKVSVGKSLGLVGVGTDEVGVGKNALMDSSFSAYTPDQWTALNHEADFVYEDFLHKVAVGRKLPLASVEAVAGGRVWTGLDARQHGLVDATGGFWTAVDMAANLARIAPGDIAFRRFSHSRGLFESLARLLGGAGAELRELGSIANLVQSPAVRTLLGATNELPRGGIELRAVNLPNQQF